MRKISAFNIARLRNDEDFGFQKQVVAEAKKLTKETDKTMVENYDAAVDFFDEALKSTQGSLLTSSLTEADQLTDEAWSGLNATVKAQLLHPVQANREAAEEAYALVKKYGNPTSLPYNEEYGALHNLIQDLTTFGAEKQKLCYIDAWTSALEERYNNFCEIRDQRTTENGAKVQGIVKQARTACDEAYKTFVSCVNALAVLNGGAEYATLIDNVNEIIASQKQVLAARKTISAKKRSIPVKPRKAEGE